MTEKILILSDIHNDGDVAADIISLNRDCGTIIFLGDGESGLEMALAASSRNGAGAGIRGESADGNGSFAGDLGSCEGVPGSFAGVPTVYQVCGNCDWYSMEPGVLMPTIGGVKICITHGHGYGVKSKAGIQSLAEYAAANGCRAALFGHTHRRFYEERDGVQLFNPGAVQNGEYGLMVIDGGEVTFRHMEV